MIVQSGEIYRSLTDFAKLADELDNKNRMIFSIFKLMSFSTCIGSLIKQHRNAVNHKNYYSQVLYHTALLKAIKLIDTNREEPKVLYNLNRYFDEFYEHYCVLPSTITPRQMIVNEIFSWFFSGTSTLYDPAEIRQKKQLADMGYSMGQELNQWLGSSVLNEKISFNDLIQKSAEEFLKWAEEHPKAASHLAADAALTCSILMEKDALDKFINTINALCVTRLFLDALGLSPEYEKVEEKELLKFRAFADLVSYCPKMATAYVIVKKAATKSEESFFSFVTNAVKTAFENHGTQKILRLIPIRQERAVLAVAELIRGDEMQKIMAHQRNLSLVQMAGGVRAILKNPHDFFIACEVYWKTIFKSKGTEKVKRILLQLILPALEVAFFAFCLFSKWWVAGVCITATSAYLNRFLVNLLDEETGFKVKIAVQEKVLKQEEKKKKLYLHYLLSVDSEKKKRIESETLDYIADLKKHYGLPNIPPQNGEKRLKLSQPGQDLLKIITKELQEKLERKFDPEKEKTASEVVSYFNAVADLKKIRMKLEGADPSEVDTVAFSIMEDLMNNWLTPNIKQVFKKRLIELSCTENPQKQDAPVITDPKTYLESKLKDEIKDLSPILKLLNY